MTYTFLDTVIHPSIPIQRPNLRLLFFQLATLLLKLLPLDILLPLRTRVVTRITTASFLEAGEKGFDFTFNQRGGMFAVLTRHNSLLTQSPSPFLVNERTRRLIHIGDRERAVARDGHSRSPWHGICCHIGARDTQAAVQQARGDAAAQRAPELVDALVDAGADAGEALGGGGAKDTLFGVGEGLGFEAGHGGRDEGFDAVADGVGGVEDVEDLFAEGGRGCDVEGMFLFFGGSGERIVEGIAWGLWDGGGL